MNPRVPLAAPVAALVLAACGAPDTTAPLYRAPALSDTIDGVVWASGNWTPWLEAGARGTSWGNHRAVVSVPADATGAEAVRVHIPWRRHDADPGGKSVVVLDAATGEPVANAVAVRVDDASGDVVFQPNAGSATYHVYYMPWRSGGGYYPTITYPSDLAPAPDPAWARRATADIASLAAATTTRMESVNDFHSFFPMEVAATPLLQLHADLLTLLMRILSGVRLLILTLKKQNNSQKLLKNYIPIKCLHTTAHHHLTGN